MTSPPSQTSTTSTTKTPWYRPRVKQRRLPPPQPPSRRLPLAPRQRVRPSRTSRRPPPPGWSLDVRQVCRIGICRGLVGLLRDRVLRQWRASRGRGIYCDAVGGRVHSQVESPHRRTSLHHGRGCTGEFSTKKMFSKLFFSQCNVVGMVFMMNTHQKNF